MWNSLLNIYCFARKIKKSIIAVAFCTSVKIFSTLMLANNDPVGRISPPENPVRQNNANAMGMGWLLPLLLLVLAAGLVYYFMEGTSDHPAVTASPFTDTGITHGTNSNQGVIFNDSSQRHHVQIQLRDTAITVFKGGMEYGLVLFVSSKKGNNKSRSFNFDSLTFKENTAQLDSSSVHEIKNVATILRAYPSTRIKISCYTDKTNNASADLQLSRDRAQRIADALENDGTNSKQIIAVQGLGSKYAMFSPDAPAEKRAKDRRVSI